MYQKLHNHLNFDYCKTNRVFCVKIGLKKIPNIAPNLRLVGLEFQYGWYIKPTHENANRQQFAFSCFGYSEACGNLHLVLTNLRFHVLKIYKVNCPEFAFSCVGLQ